MFEEQLPNAGILHVARLPAGSGGQSRNRSRSLSGLFAVTLPNARGTGLLATFTDTMDTAKARGVMVIWVVACVAAMLWLDLWTGGAALLGAGLACLYYRVMSARQFGGVTGDLAGFFLQICELGMVLMVAVVQKIEVLV